VFAKKSLTGPAKTLVESEGIIKTWQKLRITLENEFSDKVNSVQLHEMLSKRKIEKSETSQKYYLVMKELASRDKIEPEALIQYVIDGITDDSNNKCVIWKQEIRGLQGKIKNIRSHSQEESRKGEE